MLIDARTLANGATLEADVCIAGAGAAGITMALDLRESGLSVLLLESGGMDRAEETQVLSEGRMIGIDTNLLVRYLNQVGLGASDPFRCPLVVQYRA